MAKSIARTHGVAPDLVEYIVLNESRWNPNATGDMNLYYKGRPVEARGLFQITKAYHPEVSDEVAYNPILAMEWAIPKLANKQVCIDQWTTCRNYYLTN